MISIKTSHVQIDFDGQISISAEMRPTYGGFLHALKIESTRNFKTPGRMIAEEAIDETGTKVYLTFRQTESIDVLIDVLQKIKKIMKETK